MDTWRLCCDKLSCLWLAFTAVSAQYRTKPFSQRSFLRPNEVGPVVMATCLFKVQSLHPVESFEGNYCFKGDSSRAKTAYPFANSCYIWFGLAVWSDNIVIGIFGILQYYRPVHTSVSTTPHEACRACVVLFPQLFSQHPPFALENRLDGTTLFQHIGFRTSQEIRFWYW